MKIYLLFITLLVSVLLCSSAAAYNGSGMPLKYISSCEMDFNNDDLSDIAIQVESSRGWELIVLLRKKTGYDVFLLAEEKDGMYLTCHFGKTVTETTTGTRTGRVYNTLGTYIKLIQPEGSSLVYFWDNIKFQEVWTSD